MSTVRYAPATALLAPGIAPLVPEDATPHLISAATFGRMLEAEVFPDDSRIELWDGRIYEKMAKTQAHAVTGNLVALELARVLPAGWFQGSENPLTINQARIPLPDVVILRGSPKDYLHRLPLPADVGLIVEISVTSLRFDTGAKMVGYAAASIPVYWVLNLVANVILVFEQPNPTERRYQSAQIYAVGQAVPLRLDGVLIAEIPSLDLLPVRA